MIDKFIKISVSAFFFLFPVFFLTITPDFYEYNKMFLLIVFTLLLFFLYVLQIAYKRQNRVFKSSFGIPLFFISAASVISTIFQSPNAIIALTTPLSTATIIAGFILYLLLIQLTDEEFKEKLFDILTLDAILLSLYVIGLYTSILPKSLFTPAGSLLATTGFLTIMSVYILTKVVMMIFGNSKFKIQNAKPQLKIQNENKANPKETISEGELNAGISDLVKPGYLAQKIGDQNKRRVLEKFVSEDLPDNQQPITNNQQLTTILPYLLSLLLIGSTSILLIIHLATDQQPIILPFGYGIMIFLEVLKNSKTMLLGVGPSNFLSAFTLAKPAIINQSQVWNITFTASSSYLLTLLTESGIIAGFLYIVIFFKTIKLLIQKSKIKNQKSNIQIKTPNNEEESISRSNVKFSKITHGTVNYMNNSEEVNDDRINSMDSTAAESANLVSKKISHASGMEVNELEKFVSEDLPYHLSFPFILTLLFALLFQFLLPSAMIIYILTIILLAFSARRITAFKIDLSNIKQFSYALLFPAVFIMGIVGYFSGRAYLAETVFKKSLDALVNNLGTDAYNYQQKAININQYIDRYHVASSQTNLVLANALASKKDSTASGQPSGLTDQDIQNIPRLVQQSITEARTAVLMYRTNILNWDNLARTYVSLIGYAKDADMWAVKSYQQKIFLDSHNPYSHMSLGSLYLNTQRWEDAENLFREAVKLKPDLALAHFNLAVSLRGQKKYEEAYEELQTTLSLIVPNSPDEKKVQDEIKLIPARSATGSAAPIQVPVTDMQTLESPDKPNLKFPDLPKNNPTISIPQPPITP